VLVTSTLQSQAHRRRRAMRVMMVLAMMDMRQHPGEKIREKISAGQ
jgi:hypothetical protein